MSEYWARDWAGEPFRLFGPSHLALLATVAALTAAVVLFGPRIPAPTRRTVRRAAAALLVVNTVVWHIWNVAVGLWNVETMLPLHLCSVMSLVAAVALWTGHAWLGVATWLLGSPGALQALLTPEVAPYGFPHYRVLQSWTQHTLLWLSGFWIVFAEGIRPTIRRTAQVWAALHLLAAATFVVNWAVGSNYLFLNRKPEFASVLDLLPPWPGYLLVLECLVVLLLLVFTILGRVGARSAARVDERELVAR
jgi:hypothetical integral membrane protein (TIGR02206 family)